jgi:nucleoside-diphosphate-sugar epimerase
VGLGPPHRCAVTGASGFLGRRFLAAATEAWPEARFRLLVHRTPVAAPHADWQLVRGSLDEAGSPLEQLLDSVDVVIHFAGVTHAARADTYFRVNTEGTARLARAARAAGVSRFIYISSRAIAPECGDYARSKRAAEQAVEASGLPHVILRLSEIYGTGASEGLNRLIALVRTSAIVPYPTGPMTLAPLALPDAVRGVRRAVELPHRRDDVYTLAGPRSYALRELITTVAAAFGLRRTAIPIPLAALSLIAHSVRLLGVDAIRYDQFARLTCPKSADISRARRDFGFDPVSFPEGLRALQ